MLSNYFITAFRALRRRKGYAFINVFGLAVGMACCLVILLFVREELSFDRYSPGADRTYRIVSDWGGFSVPATNPPVVMRLRNDFPEIERMALITRYAPVIRYEDRVFREQDFIFANPDVFEVFDFTLARGNPADALTRPNTLVLTAAAARKYFGAEDPIGKRLRLDNQIELEVTGVLDPIPANTHFRAAMMASFQTLVDLFDYANSTNWGNNGIYTYLLLSPNVDAKAVEARLPGFIERHAGPNWNGATLSLQPLTAIHLHSHHNAELAPNADVTNVYLFSVIAFFILLIASINFINLATARSAERAREVGVRKVVGAERGQLIRQFLAESMLLSLLALALALLLASLSLPLFRTLADRSLSLDLLDPVLLATLAGFTLVVGLLSGSFPALVLSGFQPIQVLKGRFAGSGQGALLRKGLVVFQFAISIVLIVGTLVARDQLSYLQRAALGFDQDQILSVSASDGQVTERFATFREALRQVPGVQTAAPSTETFPSELLDGDGYRFEGAPADSARGLRTVGVGHGFFEALGVPIVAGRSFSLDFPTDSSGIILNEAALRELAGQLPEGALPPEQALGQRVYFNGPNSGPLIGVVKDFNMATLREAVEPIAFRILPDRFDYFLIRIAADEARGTLAGIERAWQQVYPDWPFEFTFADQSFAAAYRAEQRLSQLIFIFAGLAIVIACLGLFGLATYAAEQRTKEIGVRKVLGATVPGLVGLLSRDFLKLVLIAFVLAAPLAYFGMHRWLSGFAYHIELGPAVFLLAGGLALVIAFATVAYQAAKAATANPVDSLRYE